MSKHDKKVILFLVEGESDAVSFAVEGNYKDTWNFIQQDTNSLKRYSNIHLLFDKYKEILK